MPDSPKWRIEYALDYTRDEGFGVPKMWRVLLETVEEAIEIRCMDDIPKITVPMLKPDGSVHPAYAMIENIMKNSFERVCLRPYFPFEPTSSLFLIFGPNAIEAIEKNATVRKIWGGSEWVWLHIPGDSGT